MGKERRIHFSISPTRTSVGKLICLWFANQPDKKASLLLVISYIKQIFGDGDFLVAISNKNDVKLNALFLEYTKDICVIDVGVYANNEPKRVDISFYSSSNALIYNWLKKQTSPSKSLIFAIYLTMQLYGAGNVFDGIVSDFVFDSSKINIINKSNQVSDIESDSSLLKDVSMDAEMNELLNQQ